jgi:hypothetical protein
MGVSLFYKTAGPVSATVRGAILAEAGRINRDRRWWSESIIFFDLPGQTTGATGLAPLTGDTKLFYSGVYSDASGGYVEVDFDDDQFMAIRDAAFIVRQLVRWSREYGIDWSLVMAGAELGIIVAGEVLPPGLFGWDRPDTDEDERRAAEIDAKYASGNP